MAGVTKSSEALHPLLKRILEARGIVDLESFLSPDYRRLDAPDKMPGVVEAAEIILAAVSDAREIVVFGDYDCDGISATAIMMRTLRALGAAVAPFLPLRLEEGYGMSEKSVARLLDLHPGVGLVVTVDNGINSVDEVAALKARGIRVVITDHHLPSETLPAADAIVNPKVAAPEPFACLCGAAIAYLLARQLVTVARERDLAGNIPVDLSGKLFVLAGLATVTDVMPLVGTNRIFVSEAIRHFRQWAPVGLKELHLRGARTGEDTLGSKDFGFILGPRINASGRMSTGEESLELLLSDDVESVRDLAIRVDALNVERKQIEQEMSEEAKGKIVPGASAQLIDLPNGHPGIAGIVAARLLESLSPQVPVCVLAGGHGSARAPAGLNIRDAFVACSRYLDTYGGHAAAGGFSVKPGCVNTFRKRLRDYFRTLVPSPTAPVELTPDLWVEAADITLDLAEDMKRLEPFGEGNAMPVFGLRGVRISAVKAFGDNAKHLSLFFRNGVPRAVWWAHGDRVEELRASSASTFDIIFTVEASDYLEPHPELRIVAMRRNET